MTPSRETVERAVYHLLDQGDRPVAEVMLALEQTLARLISDSLTGEETQDSATGKAEKLVEMLVENPAWRSCVKDSVEKNEVPGEEGEAYVFGMITGMAELLFNQKFRIHVMRAMGELR